MRRLLRIGLSILCAWPFAADTLPQRTFVASTGIDAVQFVGTPIVTATRNQLQGNAIALLADGAAARLILDGNTVTGNGTGIDRFNNATIVTRGNNTVYSNGTDTASGPYTLLGGI